MKTTSLHRAKPNKWIAAPAAFLATLLALPVNAAIDIPDDPLTTAARVAPNILFILDDSGSMERDYMPDNLPATSGPAEVAALAYTRNSLSYNPSITYQPWVNAAGTRTPGGQDYGSAFSDANRMAGSINLAASTKTFFVPKDTTITTEAYLGDGRNYYLYQILGNGRVRRGEYGTISRAGVQPVAVSSGAASGTLTSNASTTLTLANVVADVVLSVAISNTTGSGSRNLNFEIRNPSNGTIGTGTVGRGNTTTYTVSPTVAGQYSIVLARASNNNTSYSITAQRYTTNGCDAASSNGAGWVNCVDRTPTGRSEADERINYATWYSYHRTRMKVAKAGSSEAFSALDGKVRVGFRTIHDQTVGTFDIPVNDGNDGRFVDIPDDPSRSGDQSTNSRSSWYSYLFDAAPGSRVYTPLRSALNYAGLYFGSSDATGPYGPLAGVAQYSCRQNFAILTTDGYWNTNDESGTLGAENSDDTDGEVITGSSNQRGQYLATTPYRDTNSNTLADIAMHYWKRDLRPDLDNNVPSSDANPAFWQHMVTFGISIGLSGTRGWSSTAAVPADATWPNPLDREDADRIDDLLHAAVNGRGSFVAATSPSKFTEGLKNALDEISNRTSSYSNIASNSVSLETGTRVYSASYTTGSWNGQLTARAVSATGVGAVQWNSTIPAWSSRRVFTRGGDGGENFPSADQIEALARSTGEAHYQVSGSENADYLKGDDSLEERRGSSTGKRLRNRTSVLGDIVSSSPAYVEDTNTIYVGANDGMLHAFDARDGRELFAYVPSILNFNHLATLSRGDYSHKFFVDGPITVSSKELTPDKHILVGTLGRGGKGLFALDVTTPNAENLAAASVAKWELSDTPEGNMGKVLGKPILAKAGDSTVAVIGNGVNSTTGRAVLIVLNAETGEVIKEIDTGEGSPEVPNGLSAPTGAYQADGKTLRYVFAGDMLGNVWKFDVSEASTAEWTATRLFTATDARDIAQPITAKVAIATHPLTRERWVFFGTGRYLTAQDAEATNVAVQSMYGIIDKSESVGRDELTQRTVTVTVNAEDSGSGMTVRAFEAKSALPANSKGWYIDLPESGERIVQDAQVASGFLVTASMVPTGTACDADGTGYINALSAFTGTSGGTSFFDLNGENGTGDDKIGTDNLPVGSVNTGAGMPTLPNILRGLTIVGGTSVIGSTGGVGIGGGQPSWERVSWIEARRD